MHQSCSGCCHHCQSYSGCCRHQRHHRQSCSGCCRQQRHHRQSCSGCFHHLQSCLAGSVSPGSHLAQSYSGCCLRQSCSDWQAHLHLQSHRSYSEAHLHQSCSVHLHQSCLLQAQALEREQALAAGAVEPLLCCSSVLRHGHCHRRCRFLVCT